MTTLTVNSNGSIEGSPLILIMKYQEKKFLSTNYVSVKKINNNVCELTVVTLNIFQKFLRNCFGFYSNTHFDKVLQSLSINNKINQITGFGNKKSTSTQSQLTKKEIFFTLLAEKFKKYSGCENLSKDDFLFNQPL